MTDVQSGLEGVVAFATEIAEPDKEGGALRYRGVNVEDLVGQVPVVQVKESVAHMSSESVHPNVARRMLREAAATAVRERRDIAPLRVEVR